MTWQDVVLSAGGFVFFLALLPTIKGKAKPHWGTSLSTTLVLAVFAITQASLGLWLTVVSTLLSCAAWGVLFVQAVGRDA